MQQAFQAIKRLVADFKAQEAAYLSPSYQESQVRQDFIDKFFTALGWDVTHERQKNPYEQEVHIENKVKMSGSSQRRADYAFFFSPNFRDPKFFVEAKKPSRNLANADDYYQAIRYGWNAKTPLAILTDFEEFHILDCRFKPNIDEAMSHKVESFHYSDYAVEEKFARIYYLISREAVAGGSIEKRAAELPKPRGKGGQKGLFKGGYQAVDEAFLEELDEYRITLAKAFKKANDKLEGEELTEAVQRTIDRLVFIRFLEDKGIEEKVIIGMKGQKSAWKAFVSLCKRCEPKYNGLVFKPHHILDEITFAPAEDKMFAEICAELADPASPYDFNQIPISILGSIYERFLGKVVHATDKRVKVEEKPEVRKAGGVYYTPEYIVRYIVKETVGKLIDDKTPTEIAPMAFADIACGSGSFLIEVYAQLLDYHVRYYLAHPDKTKPDDVFERDGKLQLTLKKKKEILLNNIYGVDIDFQATEVTQLSLYLKLLEDATMSDAHQFGLFKETILPDLRQNIVCGNSLIGRDMMDGTLFPNADESKIKPMNYTDVFPNVMKRGGFDAVVGNPPYTTITEDSEKQYIANAYECAEGRFDTFEIFIERAVKSCRYDGRVGYIVPSPLLTNVYSRKTRKLILEKTSLLQVVNFGMDVFSDPTVHTCIIVLSKGTKVSPKVSIKKQVNAVEELTGEFDYQANQADFAANANSVFDIFFDPFAQNFKKKLSTVTTPLGEICFIRQCIKTGDDVRYVRKCDKDPGQPWKPSLRGKSIERYSTRESDLYLKYGNWLARNWANKSFYETAKIAVRETGNRITATLDNENRFFLSSLYSVYPKSETDPHSLEYYLGILNSTFATYFIKKVAFELTKGAFTKIRTNQLAQLPVRTINFSNENDASRHASIVTVVRQMVHTKTQLGTAKTDAEKNRLELQCESLDRQIDEAVYELYGLTEEEIKIVEGK